MNRKPSERQIELLALLDDMDGEADGWGELWTHYSGNFGPDRTVALAFRNMDRVANALKRRGFVDCCHLGIALTDAGRDALRAAGRHVKSKDLP